MFARMQIFRMLLENRKAIWLQNETEWEKAEIHGRNEKKACGNVYYHFAGFCGTMCETCIDQ